MIFKRKILTVMMMATMGSSTVMANEKNISSLEIELIKDKLEMIIGNDADIEVRNTSSEDLYEATVNGATFYTSSDLKYLIKGDVLNVKTGINESRLSNEIRDAEKRNTHKNRMEFLTGNTDEYLDSHSTRSKFKIDDTKSISDLATQHQNETKKFDSVETAKIIMSGETNDKVDLSDKKDALVLSDKAEEREAYLESYKEKIRDRMSKIMAKSTLNPIDGSPSHNLASTESTTNTEKQTQRPRVSKNDIDTSKIFVTANSITYKGKESPKIGYNVDGSKLSDEQTKNQVANIYNRLDLMGDKYSIVYEAEGEEKAEIMVFSDPTCPVCQALHKEIPELNANGVKVSILMYPRALGVELTDPQRAQSVLDTLENIWCSYDPSDTMEKIYNGEYINSSDCSVLKEQERPQLPARQHYYLGQLFGITGTPLMFTSEGEIIKGYSGSPDRLLKKLGINRSQTGATEIKLDLDL